jgi:tripartite-type tricarboxylate transporter receptor subunit TctC
MRDKAKGKRGKGKGTGSYFILHPSAFILCCAIAAGAAIAQPYPTKPVRVIVPFAPGGGSDILARQINPKLAEYLGQPFVIDNRGGAGGLVGTEIAQKAPPDGYTLITISGSYAANAALYKSSREPATAVATIIEIGFSPFLIAVHPSVPARTLKELMALSKQTQGKLSYGTGGTGSITHLATELLALTGGVKWVHVPYKASALALVDLVGGQTQLIVGSMLPTLPHIKTGRLTGLAVTTAERWPATPNFPTVAETFPGYDVELWFGMWAPKGTPAVVVERLNAAVNKALRDPDVEKSLLASGFRITGGTSQRFAERIRRDLARWNRVVAEAGVKPE